MPDKHEVGGSSPLEPTNNKQEFVEKRKIIENRIKILKRTDNFLKDFEIRFF